MLLVHYLLYQQFTNATSVFNVLSLFFFSSIQVIYEDLPSNLCAIRDYAEKIELAKTGSIDPPVTPTSHDPDSLQFLQKSLADQVSIFQPSKSANSQRPKVPGLQTDMEVLKSEILGFISTYGQDGFMPMRKQLRQHGRVDIEKAITKMGGFREVAGLMNLSLAYKDRKPKGYWDNLENLHVEVLLYLPYFLYSFNFIFSVNYEMSQHIWLKIC